MRKAGFILLILFGLAVFANVFPLATQKFSLWLHLRAQIHQIDDLFQAGRYHAAFLKASDLATKRDTAQTARWLGMLQAVRGESSEAERLLRRALWLGLQSDERDLTLLYLGDLLAKRGESEAALTIWNTLSPCPETIAQTCTYTGPRYILQAQIALQQKNYRLARDTYRISLQFPLPPDWYNLTTYHLVLLHAATDPAGALAELESRTDSLETTPLNSLLNPIRPDLGPNTVDDLRAILQADSANRNQLLGQQYLQQQFYDLAETQFSEVGAENPDAIMAAAYAAYARWLAKDRHGGLLRLEILITLFPEDPHVRTLLALIYLAQKDLQSVEKQMTLMMQQYPQRPDTSLIRAAWYTTKRDYAKASAEYQQALNLAPASRRGKFALLVARFHLHTGFEICTKGAKVAKEAIMLLPNEALAWETLAANQYRCGDFQGAIETAQQALTYTKSAETTFYLGAALRATGSKEAAQAALVQAADLAPASVWREKAEELLGEMGR